SRTGQIIRFGTAKDYKRAGPEPDSPNTGGMGCISPHPQETPELWRTVTNTMVGPLLNTMVEKGTSFSGVLYMGLMLTAEGPKLLEINTRFGDPEAQVLLPRLQGNLADILYRVTALPFQQDERVELNWDPRPAITLVLAAEGYPAKPRTGIVIPPVAPLPPDVFLTMANVEKDEEGDLVNTGGRILNITALGDTLADARAKAYAAIVPWQVEGTFVRPDIGL
ncbi:MAG: phosphoribosylglycinamide synthetase C domain-containing protein, partial [Alphaproteobacteria bacterium]